MTTTKDLTLQEALDAANPNQLPDAFRRVKIGHMLAVVKAVATGLTSAAAQDITTAAFKAASTISGIALQTGEGLPAIADVVAVRVTAGAAAAGVRMIGDAGCTPSATVAKLSDDGKTLTFEDTVTAFALVYRPRAAEALSALLPVVQGQ